MPSVLEIEIGLHYWQTVSDYPHLEIAAAKRAVDNLLRNGLIEERAPGKPGGGYRKSNALQDWVQALTRVPFPVIE
jgi:predicted transcriptional regulator